MPTGIAKTLLASGGAGDGVVRVWDVASGENIEVEV